MGKLNISYESGKTADGIRVIPEEVSALVPPGKCFSFDTIWEVTRLRFAKYMQREEIQGAIPFHISTGSISNLSREGLAYLSCCQVNVARQLGELFSKQAFILNIDGTNEGGEYTHYRCIDNITGIVVYAKKIKSENAEDIALALREIVQLYGKPHAVVSDMSGPTRKAIIEVFGEDFPHIICQFHFLRDVGKDMLTESHENLRKFITHYTITSKLTRYRNNMSELKRKARDEEASEDFKKVEELLMWVLDYKHELTGKGVPFDLKWMQYYVRIQELYRTICSMYKNKKKESPVWKHIINIKRSIEPLLKDRTATRCFNKLCAINEEFLLLRTAFADNDQAEKQTAPLSRESTAAKAGLDAAEVRRRLEKIQTDINKKDTPTDGEIIISKHLDKYMPFLAVELVVNGKVIPLPRTNNMSELNYREAKRGIRRTVGKKNLAKALDLLPAEMAFISNIDKPEFMKIVFGEREIYEVFADICPEEFKTAMTQIKKAMPENLVGKPIRSKTFIDNFKSYFEAS